MISHSTTIRVRYADTDAMAFVYHGNYLVYFEQSRTEMLRAIGLPYSAIEEMGIFIVVVEAHIHYYYPARYDDLLNVTASIKEMPTNKIRIEYGITKADENRTLIEGYTIHTFLNKLTNKPVRPPKEFTDLMGEYF